MVNCSTNPKYLNQSHTSRFERIIGWFRYLSTMNINSIRSHPAVSIVRNFEQNEVFRIVGFDWLCLWWVFLLRNNSCRISNLNLVGATIHQNPKGEERIINGMGASIAEFGFTLSLQLRSRHICGASILSQSYALTAAHWWLFDLKTCWSRAMTTNKLFFCSINSTYTLTDFTLVSATTDLYFPKERHRLSDYTHHPQWDLSSSIHSLAVLELYAADRFNLNFLWKPCRCRIPGMLLFQACTFAPPVGEVFEAIPLNNPRFWPRPNCKW